MSLPNLKVLSGGMDEPGRVPPHSIEAEEYLLSVVIGDESGQAWGIAQHVGIKEAAFYSPANRLIWVVIEKLWKRGEVGNLAAVGLELQASKEIDSVGGFGFLAQITSMVPTTAQARYIAEQVKLLWEMRHAVMCGTKFVEDVYANTENREGFIKLAGELGQKLIRLGRREASRGLAEIYDDVAAEMEARAAGTVDTSKFVYTGLPKFDAQYRPLGSRRADGFIVLAAGSGDGKTTAMCQMGVANLEMNKRVLMFSREIDTAGFIEKGISAKLSIDLNFLETLPEPDQKKFRAECERQKGQWAGKRLWCVQQEPATPIFTVEDVVEHCRAHVHLHGVPELIMVDYLQIFDARKRIGGQNREALVAYVSHTLQALQRELGCVMVVGCQLNEKGLSEMRECKKDDEGRPKFRLPNRGDLRESQAAYHDADRVIFLFRPPVDMSGMDQHAPGLPTIEVWWYQEKRRAGGTGYTVTKFEKRFCRFVEVGHKQPTEQTALSPKPTGALPTGARVSKTDFMKGKL